MDYYASYKNSKDPSLLRKELVSYAQRMALSCFAATVLFLDMETVMLYSFTDYSAIIVLFAACAHYGAKLMGEKK